MNLRYSRQQLFRPIGNEGQDKLSRKHVLIIGAGALGTGIAETLARSGVGTLTIVDRDYVEWSNLQRQHLYSEEDARQRLPKAVAAQQRLQQINSEIVVNSRVMDVTLKEIEELVAGIDLIMDATDNFETRLLINDISQKNNIPWIYGACVGSSGLSFTILPQVTCCLNCMLEQLPVGGATCDTMGVITPIVQMIVAIQTSEAIKILIEDLAALHGKLICFDIWNNLFQTIHIERMKKHSCPSCGENRTYPHLIAKNQSHTAVLCGRDTVQIRPAASYTPNLQELADTLRKQGGHVETNPYLISLTIGAQRMVIFKDGRVLIHGTDNIAEARSLYHRYLG